MEQQEQPEQDQTIVAASRRKENDFNVIKKRIDTAEFLDSFQTFLTGSKVEKYVDSEGNIVTLSVNVGKPKANVAGVQTIMQRMNCIINTHTIQGNFPFSAGKQSESYENYCYDCEIDLITDVMSNLPDYEIDDTEFSGIINSAMAGIKPIMSRCIGNKERESYGETTTHVESHSQNPQKKGFLQSI